MALYQVGLMGDVSQALHDRFVESLRAAVTPLNLQDHIEVVVANDDYDPKNDYASVVLYFGAEGLAVNEARLRALMRDGTPVLPLVKDLKRFSHTTPECLHVINGLELDERDDALARPVSLALEMLGLLPRQRRIFVSYKRDESTEAALQLFEYLSQLKFDVFLDTHGVPAGDDFQEVLWHRLSDSDVLVMLDTAHYFESRWTSLEFGRALAKSLVPLRIGWPEVVPAPRSLAGESLQLTNADFEPGGKRLTPDALVEAGVAIEKARSRGLAMRSAEMNGAVIVAAEKIDGRFLALGPKRSVIIELPPGRKVVVCPVVGVPSAEHLHEASMLREGDARAVAFDDAGVAKRWQDHLTWLGGQVSSAQFIRKGHAAWDLAALE
jgi:hypothetical protein